VGTPATLSCCVPDERSLAVVRCARLRADCARGAPEACADNLAANYSRELADFIIYVIDVAGGDKIPRKGGPGITQADLLVRTSCQGRRSRAKPSCAI